MRPRLRPYQIDDLRNLEQAFETYRALCYVAPTASGKTVLFAEYIRRELGRGGRVLALGHRDEIVRQISRALTSLGIKHGIIAPDHPETEHRVQVASVMTLVRRLRRLRRKPTLLVIDEAHHAAAKTWQKIIAALSKADVLGVTATPRRLDGKPLDDIFDHLVRGPSIAALIDDGYLAPVRVFTPAQSPDLSQVRIRAGDYAVDQLGAVMSRGIIVNGAVDEFRRLCPNASAIAFCVDIKHSKLVAEAFRRRGYRAEHVDGETPRGERRDLIAALDDGDIDILCNCGLISEGLDVPGVEAAILLRPTKSLALYLQMIGRALRPGKPLAYVLDCAGNVYRHGLPTANRRWSLHGHQQEQQQADRIRRCPNCGAINEASAEVCEHCGAVLAPPQRPPRLEIAGPRLTEAVEVPLNDTDLEGMSYHAMLRWAAGADGRLRHDRLQRIARLRGYAPGWVWHMTGKTFDRAWQSLKRWRETQTTGGGQPS